MHEVSVGFDPRVLLKQVEVYPVFKSNEPDLLAKLGVPVRLFDATDYGIPMLGLAFITNRVTAAQRPDVVRRFLRAALRGLADAIADRDGAIDATMTYAVGEDRAHQRFMLDAEIKDAASADPPGWITRERWAAQESTLGSLGVLAKRVDVASVVDDSFVDYAVSLAIRAGIKKLFLFHQDPDHDDAKIESMVVYARLLVSEAKSTLQVDAAREGLVVELAGISKGAPAK